MHKLNKRKLILIIIIAVLAGLTWHFFSKKGGAWAGGMPPMPVSVAVAKTTPWQQQLQATGTLTASQGVMLKSEVAGRVTKVYIQSGQSVKAGDPLVDIDPSILQAQLTEATAKASLSQGDYERAIALYKRGALSEQDLDTALSNSKADAASVVAAQAALDQNEIRAPFSGRLGLKLVNLGDYISTGQSLINLQNLDPLRVDFTIPENYLSQVQVGDKVQIQSDAYPNQIFTANVTAIDSAIDQNTRSIAVRARIPNPDQKLLPGAFVQVTLMVGQAKQIITIPQVAVVYDASGNYVYTVVNQHAVKQPITIGNQNADQIAVTSGLKPGDVVVTAGQIKITDGAPVMPLPLQKSS